MRSFWMGCLICLLAMPALAQDVPAPLRDWQGWVLHDYPQHACPFLTGNMPAPDTRRCLWPGQLDVAVDAHGGRFSVTVKVDAESWLALPGDDHHWPQQVTDHGHAIAVHESDGAPVVHLAAGQHQLAGRWSWSSMPARLAMPDVYGLVGLKMNGKSVADIERQGDALTLGASATGPHQADALSIQVFRHLQDGLPPRLVTRMQLAVSGQAREVTLGPVLPPDFVATQLDAAIPARLDNDGKLHLQLRPGRWQITLRARGTEPLAKVAFALPKKPWPSSEVWSYDDDPGLRQTRIEGHAVDANQAGVPSAWRNLPAFAVTDGHGLAITAGARAGQGGVSEKIRVNRRMWLDFDGDGFTASDYLTGRLDHPRRLDVQSPWQLQSARNVNTPLLVSKGKNHSSGIELRDDTVDIDAGLYLPRSALGTMPANGWQVPLDSLDVTLQLPPGYRLLGAPGADQSRGSWVGSWTLLDLFVVALIALLCGRLLGWPMGLVAAIYLVLAHEQAFAPYLTLLIAAALALLTRALPSGRLRGVTHGVALAFVAVAIWWSLPFAATQLRDALYPQLEKAHTYDVAVQDTFIQPPPKVIKMVKPPQAPPAPPPPVMEQSSNAVAAPPPMPAPPREPLRMPPLQTNPGPVQSGPGIPDWNVGNTYELGWSGPVTPDQTMRLVIAPAWLVRLLRVLAVVALAALLARLLTRLLPTRGHRRRVSASSAVLLLAAIVLVAPGAVRAGDTPSQTMLKQLQQRLLEPPACAPDCALLADGRLTLTGERMTLLLQAQVEAPVAVPLPMTGDGSYLKTVRVDGHPAALAREGGQPLLRLNRGVHSVQLDWRVRGDALRLAFGALKPKHMQISAPGWVASGLDDVRLAGDTVRLTRQSSKATQDHAGKPVHQSFPAYVRLTRTLRIGSDWRIRNTVQRIAPAQAGFSVSLPLLPGEHPLDADTQIKDGRITVNFRAGQQVATWLSRVEPFDTLDLKAPPLARRSELWQIQAAPTWHVEAEGIPPQPADNMLAFAPLPGETLAVNISRPAPLQGSTVAVDTVRLDTSVGEHARDMHLMLAARSTHGGEHTIATPDAAQLLHARRDDESLTVALRNGRVSLPLRPGTHDYSLALRQQQDMGLVTRTPVVDLGAQAANIDLGLTLPHDRWILWTWGPQNGPAVLYWPQLIVLLLLAYVLTRFAPTPLKLHHWILLGLGFSTFAWSAFALVTVWLILLGLRERSRSMQDLPRLGFNAVQICLALLTLLAILVLVAVVPRGLLGVPDMHIAGNGSTAQHLQWMLDRSTGELPRGGVLSLPLWCYKLAILAWALWLANALVHWLRWAFGTWSQGGYWRGGRNPATPGPQPDAGDA
ncbi:MAG TPA: hypothetical protein VFL78_08030 [Rhodanobacteraceae bacterium]|nr:hypothetical protein [Rhodanobacteraceae bacterium]